MTLTIGPAVILGLIAIYFLVLLIISYFTGKNSSNANFFLAGKKAPWLIVAFGMIGSSLSGVTFLSIPGVVGKTEGLNMAFSYLQLILGNWVGYLVVAFVLLPLYYRLNLTSIYGYLAERLGWRSYKIGAGYFLLSRMLGSSLRLFLVALVLSKFVFEPLGVPFWITVAVTILLIWLYTNRGGINTIIWTDTFQTLFMLVTVILSLYGISSSLDLSLFDMAATISNEGYSKVFFFEGGWSDPNNFFKQFIAGVLITIVMTGLDQDMMQKNLSCKNIKDARKNMLSFSVVFVIVNLLFLALGAALYIYAKRMGIDIPTNRDELFATLALNYFSPTLAIFFILGLIAAAYSSADSALTAMTTSFCVDFLGFERRKDITEARSQQIRIAVHIGFSVLTFLVILLFYYWNNDSVINILFKIAAYTYGPLLGLFAFGILTRRIVKDRWVPVVCLVAPLLSALLDYNSKAWLGGFEFGFLILAFNGLITFMALWVLSEKVKVATVEG